MSLLGDLFGEDGNDSGNYSGHSGQSSGKSPMPPRNNTGLCGIHNQGATCYLNSLVQSLVMTPEFREALFEIGEGELGRLEDKGKSKQVRIIPIQLQRLFSRLLLLNAQAASTTELTDSFGWTNNEELVQHDVQELNRILFNAIEDSLVGTSGRGLIKDLYHGLLVNQIVCQSCGRCSEREEDFLDLCVTVKDCAGLEEGLNMNYVWTEMLEGNNKYRCEGCSKLVDAKKGAKLRHLPPILCMSLLRFNFDFVKCERYKETGKFTFPHDIDMAPYCENLSTIGDTEYELFSVVIHRGSTHGGHYHAYIRDVDALGNWTHPQETHLQVPTDPTTGQVDFIECDSPLELMVAILSKTHGQGLPVDKLGGEIMKQTGVSWNKRFKNKHGALNKFIKKYDDKFELNQITNWVYLKTYSGLVDDKEAVADSTGGKEHHQHSRPTRPVSPPPPNGHCWFNFDDSRVQPISGKEIESQFSGKESAYMLFYRRKSLHRPSQAMGNPEYGLNDNCIAQVIEENVKLEDERKEYEIKMNTIVLHVHFDQFFTYKNGALQTDCDTFFIDLTIDRRKSVQDLKREIKELGGELTGEEFEIHQARDLPAGWHLQYSVEDGENVTIATHLRDQDNVFVWDGKQVNGSAVPTGPMFEPLLLNVRSGERVDYTSGFSKSLTALQLREMLAEKADLEAGKCGLSRVVTKGEMTKIFEVLSCDMDKTLEELRFENGDHVVCEDKTATSGNLAEKQASFQANTISFIVENRCKGVESSTFQYPLMPVQVDKTASVAELKVLILSQCDHDVPAGGGRIRKDDDNRGLRPPLHEEQSVTDAGLQQGNRLVIEPGVPPASSQITVSFSFGDTECEVMLDGAYTVQQCLNCILEKAKISGDGYHLRMTNWCNEAGAVLDDMSLSLEQCGVVDGSYLLLRTGKLPPKGFLKLPVWSLPAEPQSSTHKDTDKFEFLGEVVISKTASVDELKRMVIDMLMPDVPLASTLRLRVLEEGKQPTAVLRNGAGQTLQRAKISNTTILGAQKLTCEEHLSQNAVLLNVVRRVGNMRCYESPQELVWDPAGGAVTAFMLRQTIADLILLPVECVSIAKHLPDKYEWIVIKDTATSGGPSQSSKRGQKGGKKKVKPSIKNAPYFLKDGDTIGVKDLTEDSSDDFSTLDDDTGKNKLLQEAEEKKKKRAASKKGVAFDIDFGGGGDNKRRQELGIKIHVDNFS